ncbi:hypothetical protein [Endozoicomonas sp. ALB115]|uniref:hypothetical protein n=1 Tax=Endozoicomonas sp. ALB115 TaxID=3403074 RepID=UPI003BB55F01
MINNTVENITYYVKAAIKLPLNIVRWFCGRVVAIAHNISNFLSKRSDQNDSSDLQQKDISDRTVSSSHSQPMYHVRETVTTAVFPFGNLEKYWIVIAVTLNLPKHLPRKKRGFCRKRSGFT